MIMTASCFSFSFIISYIWQSPIYHNLLIHIDSWFVYTYIHIDGYKTMRLYIDEGISIEWSVFTFLLEHLSNFYFRFCLRPHFPPPLWSSSTFIVQRYRRQGTRQVPAESLLEENFSWPSEIKDCGFLKTLPPIPCLSFPFMPTILPCT